MLPVRPPVKPMLAKLAYDVPEGADWWYEPKWDGFRALIFRDGDEVEIRSRNDKSLTRYFPEVLEPLRRHTPQRCVLDGELVIATDSALEFDFLSQRIHPAASRIELLSREIPATFVAFDLLALDETDLRQFAFSDRRRLLEAALEGAKGRVMITPVTRDATQARDWYERFEGAGFDGVMAKPGASTYREDERVMVKVKHRRTTDCVVGGFRWHKVEGTGVGSLLLGLYDDAAVLHHVGVASGFSAALRKELEVELAPHRLSHAELDSHPWAAAPGLADEGGQRRPGAQSRWTGTRELAWEPLRIGLVAEVSYEHMQGDRFRHTARFLNWRPDRDPESCTYAQLHVPAPVELAWFRHDNAE